MGYHREPEMRIALKLLCGVATWALLAPASAQNAAVPSPPQGAAVSKDQAAGPAIAAPAAGAFRKIAWDDVTPKDWNPMKEFKALNMSALSDSDPWANAMLTRLREVWDNAPTKGLRPMDAVWISGALRTVRADTSMVVSSYRMDALLEEPYTHATR